MDWFLYDRWLHHERVKNLFVIIYHVKNDHIRSKVSTFHFSESIQKPSKDKFSFCKTQIKSRGFFPEKRMKETSHENQIYSLLKSGLAELQYLTILNRKCKHIYFREPQLLKCASVLFQCNIKEAIFNYRKFIFKSL